VGGLTPTMRLSSLRSPRYVGNFCPLFLLSPTIFSNLPWFLQSNQSVSSHRPAPCYGPKPKTLTPLPSPKPPFSLGGLFPQFFFFVSHPPAPLISLPARPSTPNPPFPLIFFLFVCPTLSTLVQAISCKSLLCAMDLCRFFRFRPSGFFGQSFARLLLLAGVERSVYSPFVWT